MRGGPTVGPVAFYEEEEQRELVPLIIVLTGDALCPDAGKKPGPGLWTCSLQNHEPSRPLFFINRVSDSLL